jgi:hypothetical protein
MKEWGCVVWCGFGAGEDEDWGKGWCRKRLQGRRREEKSAAPFKCGGLAV